MATDKIPLDVDKFLAKHGKDKNVVGFSREAVGVILTFIKSHNNGGEEPCNWRVFFKNVKEVWSEGVITIPRDKLKLMEEDIKRLDEIKKLKESGSRCSELVYETASIIARSNSFTFLSNGRFLVPAN